MGLWRAHVVPRLVDKGLDIPQVRQLRDQVCSSLAGEVMEIGFGSGLNAAHYPPEVEEVCAVEPSDVGWRLAEQRLRSAGVPVQRSGLDGQALPFPAATFDTALSTFTLCTIPDVAAALREVRRVLRPGGTLHLVEHGRAPDEEVVRWQTRLEPIQKRIAGGCHLSRPVDELLTAAGFDVLRLDRSYLPKEPRVFGALYEGVAAG